MLLQIELPVYNSVIYQQPNGLYKYNTEFDASVYEKKLRICCLKNDYVLIVLKALLP